MSKQSNPISFRLGLSQNWNTTFNCYNINFIPYINLLYTQIKIKRYITKVLKRYNLIGNIPELIIHSQFFNLTLYYFNKKEFKSDKILKLLKKIYFTSIKWTNSPLIINFYKQQVWTNTSYLLMKYIKFLIKKQNFKYIFRKKIQIKLINQINKKTICYNIFGPKILKLIGIKICCKGRFGNHRSSLSQTYKILIGSLPSLKLNSYIDHNQDYVFTKRGVYGIQIWIFYS